MEEFQNYLESSTVHGLFYIGTTRRLVKLFWIFVVMTGFIGAGILIQQSFQSWQDSPVKTTIETRPISEVIFPLITVCPPKGTYTNLNYDLEKTKEMKIDIKKYKDDLYSNYIKHFHDLDYQNYATELKNNFEEDNMYKNWYNGVR